MATEYSPLEIAFFKAVVEQIMLAPNESYSISSMAALREVSSLKGNMTKTQAEVLLSSFVARGWLVKSRRGPYSLSTRTLLELQPYLRQTYPDEILECTICMEMVTRGVACYTPQCKTRLHKHCLTNYRKRSQNCPTCNENWSSNMNKLMPVGEAAFKNGQDKHKQHTRRQTTEESDEGEEEDGNEDVEPEESQPSQPPQPSQSQAKKAKRKAVREESMDVDDEDEATPPPRIQKRKGRR